MKTNNRGIASQPTITYLVHPCECEEADLDHLVEEVRGNININITSFCAHWIYIYIHAVWTATCMLLPQKMPPVQRRRLRRRDGKNVLVAREKCNVQRWRAAIYYGSIYISQVSYIRHVSLLRG